VGGCGCGVAAWGQASRAWRLPSIAIQGHATCMQASLTRQKHLHPPPPTTTPSIAHGVHSAHIACVPEPSPTQGIASHRIAAPDPLTAHATPVQRSRWTPDCHADRPVPSPHMRARARADPIARPSVAALERGQRRRRRPNSTVRTPNPARL
jgi:hypothetical protein